MNGTKSASYGELAAEAATLPVPENVPLKDPKDFTLIGTNVKRIEGESKVDGSAEFSMDVKLPGNAHRRRRPPTGVRRQSQELRRRQGRSDARRRQGQVHR